MASCKYCNRALRAAESVQRGCGMNCAKRNNVITLKDVRRAIREIEHTEPTTTLEEYL